VESQRGLLASLEAGRPGPLAFVYEAGTEAGLSRHQLLTRAAAIFFSFCAANLADDLTDGDCTYIEEPFRIGPPVQFGLHHLCFLTLAKIALPSRKLAAVARDLALLGGEQATEVSTQRWRAPRLRTVIAGIAGRQWSAYLQILWCNTALAKRAAVV